MVLFLIGGYWVTILVTSVHVSDYFLVAFETA